MCFTGKKLRIVLGAGVWLAALIVGFATLQRYASAAGGAHAPVKGVAEVFAPYRNEGRALAVMAIHPRCPCTEASLSELGDFLARAGAGCDALIVHVVPPGADWPAAKTRDLGARNVPVVADQNGQLATQLGAETSGHLVLFDAAGQVRFHGGITRSRGHRGKAPAQDAMLSVLSAPGSAAEVQTAPVYGCALIGSCSPSHVAAP